ncbi:unnamed protein product [Blepharisma stoltei]|uniref:Receptor ligand binding region domain-containing protein n=1 Tax=Blepharisma stoltei TaxID=1481888 RepID=A0AAU9JYK1_9CILI|nr:unnamed protein product [Blepharisma stoltei]
MQHSRQNSSCNYQRFIKALFTLIMLSASSEVLIAYSKPSSVTANLISNIRLEISGINSTEISLCDFSQLEEEILARPNLLAIFDITNSLDSEFKISKLCEDNFLIHFVVSDNLVYHNKKTFSLSCSKQILREAFIATLGYFNWTDGIALTTVEKYSDSQLLLNDYSIELFSLSSNSSIQNFVQRDLMNLGSSLFYLFADKNTSLEIQQALMNSKMLASETGILLIGESSYGSTVEGALAVVEKGRELVDSYEKYLSVALSELILILNNISTVDDLWILLSKMCPNHYCFNQFSLINISQGQRKVVGSIVGKKISITSPIIFPGNLEKTPASQKKILYISANDGITNPGSVSVPAIIRHLWGLTLAVKTINTKSDILQNFQLKVNDFDCGVSIYNATFFNNCISKDRNKLGLAHIFSIGTPTAYGEIATLAKLNITIPCVGAINVDPGLSNMTQYPFYTRVSLPSNVLYAQAPLILKVLGWSSVAVLYQNDSLGITAYHYISQTAEKQKIKIVNSLKIIPALLNRDQLKNYTNVIQDIIDSHARMVIYVLNPPLTDYVTELFYDLGIRKGDIFIYSVISAWLSSIGNKDDYTYKRLNIAVPLMTVIQSAFVDEKGRKIHDELYAVHGNNEPTSYSCLYYDATYLIAAALDWTINQGNDYTNPYILQASIRNIKFTGCSGKIYIQKDSNDVQLTSLTIQSNYYNASTDILTAYNVGYFTPTSLQMLAIESPIIYADGTTNKPADFITTRTSCPFDDKLRRRFPKGQGLAFGICFFVVLVTVIATFYIWKKWWNINVEELIKSEEISVEDMIVGATIVVEFFQLLSQGPDIRPLNSFLANIGDALSLDLKNFSKLEDGVFWWFAGSIITLCVLWAIFCVEIIFHLDEKFNRIWFFRELGVIADYSMPILGNLCFIPFISILLEIFVCDHSIGNNWSDSYLSVDCYQFCWQGNHLTFAILSALSLVLYEPLAVFCRPLWQEFQHTLHVKSFPLYLMIKTIIQVMLIVLNKTIKRSNDIAHGFIFSFMILLYLAFVWRFKAYNYGRFNWWHQLSLVGVAWVSCLSTINFLVEGSSFPWVALIIAGWAIIILTGLLVQKKKYPSLLFRKKGKDTSSLFKFAFTFGKKSRTHHLKIEPQTLDLFKS